MESSHRKTQILFAVSQSSERGYRFPSFSTSSAFNWILNHMIRVNNHQDYHITFLHVQIPFDASMCAVAEGLYENEEEYRQAGLQFLAYFRHICETYMITSDVLFIEAAAPKEAIVEEVSASHPDCLLVWVSLRSTISEPEGLQCKSLLPGPCSELRYFISTTFVPTP